MLLTIEVPAKIEQKAAELGVDVRVLLRQAFDFIASDGATSDANPFGLPMMTRAEATAAIRNIQRTHTLGGEATIKELIEERRRF
jgi:hypothetical protein